VRCLIAVAALFSLGLLSTYADEDTPAAAKTRKLLKEKVTVSFKDTSLKDVVEELKDQINGLKMQWDSKGGVSGNQTITYSGKDVTLEEALDQMFKKSDLGYIVISNKNNAYNGSILIRKGKERGYPMSKDDK
jgi:type II secretory pathway component GspD/PulD (secretin)